MLAFAIALLSMIYLGDQHSSQHHAAECEQSAAFDLSFEKVNYFAAEPVNFTVTLHNLKDEPIKGYFGFLYSLNIYYRRVGEEFIRYTPRRVAIANRVCGYIPSAELPAQVKWESSGRLFYDTEAANFVLKATGEYEFKAGFLFKSLTGESCNYESNIVRINVLPPVDRSESAALKVLSNPQLAMLIEGDLHPALSSFEELERGVEQAVDFLEKYPQSSHWSLVKQQLMGVLVQNKERLNLKLEALYNRLISTYGPQYPE